MTQRKIRNLASKEDSPHGLRAYHTEWGDFYRCEEVDELLQRPGMAQKVTDPQPLEAADKQLELSCRLLEQAFAIRCARLQQGAALWKLRWRHANTLAQLFEEIGSHDLIGGYYTAAGLGPMSRPYVDEYAPGHFVQYKHTARDWVGVWQNVAEKLFNKVREANAVLRQTKALGG